MKAWTIIGYAYKADIYCSVCVVERLREDNPEAPTYTVEDTAKEFGIDTENEHTFDSDDFPKVVFAADIEEAEYCCRCHGILP